MYAVDRRKPFPDLTFGLCESPDTSRFQRGSLRETVTRRCLTGRWDLLSKAKAGQPLALLCGLGEID
jgi:hypothetical protein